jgi:single-strand DNA-binding protein
MSLNKVMLIGRLGNDPEKKVTQSGAAVASFSLATTDSYKDKQGNKQESTTWHKVVLWNKLADLAEQYLSKGKKVYIEGILKNNEWTDKDGNKRVTTEVTGQTMEFLEPNTSKSDQKTNYSKNNNQNNNKNQRNNQNPNQSYNANSNSNSNNIDDDFIEVDIPF